MTAHINSAFVSGIDSFTVSVECCIESGGRTTTVIGVSDDELVPIVRHAIMSSGYEYPSGQVVVQIYPKLPCSTTLVQAAVAVAILVESKQLDARLFEDKLVVGELTLSGSMHATRGTINSYLMARQMGWRFVTNPTLKSLREFGVISGENIVVEKHEPQGDFAGLVGYETLKRALVVAAVGNHPLLAVGTDADTVMAQAAHLMPTVLEPLDENELMELAGIYSAGRAYFNGVRPVRMPHNTISLAGMAGGGRPVMPGEVTLAHNGVLYLGEVDKFNNDVLFFIRPVMDDGEVRIVRAEGMYNMPANFLLLASAKPCPCGHLGDPNHECYCSPLSVMRYQERLGGAIQDKFHMRIDVVRPNSVVEHAMTSAEMKDHVTRGKEFARKRGDNRNEFTKDAVDACGELIRRLGLTELSKMHIVDVARTIADIDECDHIEAKHVIEASAYRFR